MLFAPASQDYIDINVVIDLPSETIQYVPKFWTEVKFAWIKYAAMFTLWYYVLHNFFLNAVVTQGAFETMDIADIDLSGTS